MMFKKVRSNLVFAMSTTESTGPGAEAGEPDYTKIVENTLRTSSSYLAADEILNNVRERVEDAELNDVNRALDDLEERNRRGELEDLGKRSVLEYEGWEEPFDRAYEDNGEDVDWRAESNLVGKMTYGLPSTSAEEFEQKYSAI